MPFIMKVRASSIVAPSRARSFVELRSDDPRLPAKVPDTPEGLRPPWFSELIQLCSLSTPEPDQFIFRIGLNPAKGQVTQTAARLC